MDMSKSFPNKNHDDVRRHDSTVQYIFYGDVRRHDNSKLVKYSNFKLYLAGMQQNCKIWACLVTTVLLTSQIRPAFRVKRTEFWLLVLHV